MLKLLLGVFYIFLTGETNAQASDEVVQFKNYPLGTPVVEFQKHTAASCVYQNATSHFEISDRKLRDLERQRLQMFVFKSGEIICKPKRRETAVSLPVESEFAFFSNRLEQVIIRFPSDSYDRYSLNFGRKEEMQALIEGLTKRYGSFESQKRRLCRNGACGHVSDEYTYIWHGRDSRVELVFLEHPSVPAVLKYTSNRFDNESKRYEEQWRLINQKIQERQRQSKAEDDSRRAKDF